ncbi:MAG: hypothetical protein ACYSYV_12050 [Planctomycetota bacterium]
MSDKDLSLAEPLHEEKVSCEKDSCSRVFDAKSTIIILSLLLLWTIAFVVVIRHVLASRDNTAQVAETTGDGVIRITNETSRLAEERWKREGGPSSEDRWRQEQAAKSGTEERRRSLCTLPGKVKLPAPATSSRPAARSSDAQRKIDAIIAKRNEAYDKREKDILSGKVRKVDFGIQGGIDILADQYGIESETLNTHLAGIVRVYRVADDTIGFAGVWLVIALSGLAICELSRRLFLGLFHYVVNRLV